MRQITFEAGDAEISVLIKIIKSMISPSIFITQRLYRHQWKAFTKAYKTDNF